MYRPTNGVQQAGAAWVIKTATLQQLHVVTRYPANLVQILNSKRQLCDL